MATAEADVELSESDERAVEEFERMPDRDAASKTVEELAEEGEESEGQTFLDFGETLSLTMKGKKPNESKLKIRAISRDIKGQLGDKGDDEEVFVLVRASLDEVQTKSFRDDNRKVRAKRRLHILEPVGVVKLPSDVAENLFDQFS